MILPQGCPAVIGGGVVRDGIMGGQPNDIDVWLPSNINITSTEGLRLWCRDAFNTPVEVIFNGPENVHQDGEGYRDMSNHCVLEFTNMFGFKINIMRTMTPWVDGDPSAFFRGVMRNFDIDLCMFFVAFGYETYGTNTPYVIMPRHLVNQLTSNYGVMPIRQFCWNRFRLENMSDARRTMRSEKMHSKFTGLSPHHGLLFVEEIEPQVVTVAWLMSKIEFFPYPANVPLPRVAVSDTIGVSRVFTDPERGPQRLRGFEYTFIAYDEATNTIVPEEDDPNAAPLEQPPQVTAIEESWR